MTDELLDIFDKKGKKIGTATNDEAHQKGLIHQVVDVLIFNNNSRKYTLLQKRSQKVIQDPGKWQCGGGGHVSTGERPRQALLRELKEELFVEQELPKIKIKKISTYFGHDLPGNYEICHLYKVICPGPFNPDKGEVACIRWVEWNELLTDMKHKLKKYSAFFHRMVKEYQKYDNK